MSVRLPNCGCSPSSFNFANSRRNRFRRAGDGVDAVPRPRRVAWRALHGHEHIDAAAIAERNLEAGAAEHGHVGAYAGAFDYALDGIVLAGLTRQAAGEDELTGNRRLRRDHGLHRVQHRGEIGLLLARTFAHDALAGQAVLRAVDDVAVVRIRHGRGRLIHRIADDHQRFAAGARPVGRDQVAHGVVADIREAHRAQAGLDRLLDEFLQQRLVFQQFRLRAWHLDQTRSAIASRARATVRRRAVS